MEYTTTYVDAVGAMKGLTVYVRYRRFTEWQLRTWLGLALIRLGLRITGTTVAVECEDDEL